MESEEGEDEGRARGTGQAGGGCGCSRLSLFAGSCTAVVFVVPFTWELLAKIGIDAFSITVPELVEV